MSVAALSQARELYASQRMSVAEIMNRTGFRSRTTFYKYVVNGEKQA
jgi:transcriptional regulator GlxA family with amidase domain